MPRRARRGTVTTMAGMRFEFRLDGRLSESDRAAFADMEVSDVPPQTILDAEVVDEAHLHGIIALCRRLGITVVSVHRIPD